MQQKENKILIYQDDNGITKVNVRFSDEDVWLTQAQIVEIYHTSKSCPFSSNVSTIFAL